MAAKQEDAEASNPVQDLTCPLCLDIFEDTVLLTSCRHTFCRKCLKKYDLSHQDLDHMVCPLCRKVTKLSANRVDDLPTNVTVNELVDDYHYKCGGVNAVLERRPKCNVCTIQGEAVSFCRTCNAFMCENCLLCHKLQTLFFAGHEIISIKDIIEGNISIGHPSEKCLIHKQENKDMFCEDCKVHACFKCVILSHRDHKLKSHEDFEKDLKAKVNELVQCCKAKKSELEKNIQSLETHRHEIHTALQKLRTDVNEAYSTKAKQLEENQRLLVQQIDDLEHSFDEDLDALKSIDRQRIKSICSSMDLVTNDRLGRLESDSLSAHSLLCEELQGIMKELTDHTSAASITEKAHKKRFKPADSSRLDLGNITEGDPEPAMTMLKKATDHSSETAVIAPKAQEKRFQPADATRLDLGNITEGDPEPAMAMLKKATDHSSETAVIAPKAQEKKFQPADATRLDLGNVTDPKLEVIKCVDLRGETRGMTVFSDSSVAVGYGRANGIDIIDLNGKKRQYVNISSNARCYDLVFQRDRTVCISKGNTKVHVYSPSGSWKSTIQVNDNGYRLRLNRSPLDEILVAHCADQVYIYDPTGSTLKHTVPTKYNITKQTSSTTAGLIVTSSCDYSNPSMVTVYDRNGNAGKPLQAPHDVHLYAAEDEQDRVYVASVDSKNDTVVIRFYDLDGLNLKERVQFNALNLRLNGSWCYLVSLSPTMLAFACDKKLYFIKVMM